MGTRVSPGRLTALWVVLRSLRALGGAGDRETLLSSARRSSLRSGGLPIRDGFLLASKGRFIDLSGEKVSLDTLGTLALSITSEDEPTEEVRRLLLSALFLADPPPWVAYWQGDPDSLELVLPQGDRASLREARLYPPAAEDFDRWAFWQALQRVPLPATMGETRKLIGNAGEQLSLAYERTRLTAEGFPALAQRVRWVAQESDAYGFDIASYAGAAGRGVPDEAIAVEVKASALPASSAFAFYLSAHEWEVAESLGARYVLHLWAGVNPGPPVASKWDTPWLVHPTHLVDHVPTRGICAQECRWESARLILPLDRAISA